MGGLRFSGVAIGFVLLALTLGMARPAQATVAHGVKLRWVGGRPAPAQAGKEFVGQFEISASAPGRVEGLGIAGPGWTINSIDSPPGLDLEKGQRRVVTFRVVPQDPTQPLTIRYTWQGRTIERSLRLDAASLEKKFRPRPVRYLKGQGPKLSGVRPRLQESPQKTTDTALHFSGTFRYTRGDGVVLGADNIVVKVWDDDSPDPFDEVIWSGITDHNGHFDANVIWDDCDISGCDDPDIYLEIIATGPVVDVQQDDLFETTYSWETPVINDFTGNDIDFGFMYPNDSNEDAAVHIFNSIIRADRWASNKHNMTAGQVDAIWPDNDDPTHYDPYYEEIHIAPERMWNELSHTHEFGHHLHNKFGNLLESDYDNGFCDSPTPGHCVWCPEHVGEAWQEGFADWYGQVVTEDYMASYGYDPWAKGNDSRYGMDGLGLCEQDNNSYPGALTEGYVMALLRDIEDPVNDDHDGGAADCDIDATSLDSDEIMTVFQWDDPTDITMFLNSFRTRYPYYEMDLWSTVRNVDPGMGFPLPDPVVQGYAGSCRLVRVGESTTLQVAGNGSLLQYQWRRNGVNLTDGSGVSGAPTPLLTLSPVTSTMGGNYDCVVKTCDGTKSVTSTATRLTVLDGGLTARPYLTWGEDYGAQCGDGTNVDRLPPGSYTHLANVVAMDGGRSYSMALDANGTVYTWGRTEYGELGNGLSYNNNVYTPTPINLQGAIQIAAGYNHVLALRRDGGVVGWGWNGYGEIGDSSTIMRTLPKQSRVSGCIVAVAAGQYFSLALQADGTVLSFGNNQLGELGTGSIGGWSTLPVQVSGLTNIVAICAGGYTAFALESDGTVWSWGYNAFGQLGRGNTTDSGVPTQIAGLSHIRAISAAYYNGYAISDTGAVYAWGARGAIGDGSNAQRNSPVLVPGIVNPKKIVAGDAGWAMGLMQDGTLRAWGYNVNGVLATGAPLGTYQYTPQPVLNVVAVNNLEAGTATAHVLGHLNGVTGVETQVASNTPSLALRVAPVPSRSVTSLAFDLPASGPVKIAIYDVAGRLVRTILSETQSAGYHQVTWDGRIAFGAEASAGVYFARLDGARGTVTRRIVLMR